MHVQIGDKRVGDGYPVYIVGEIGINHNGDMGVVKRLINVAAEAGCDAIKLQKRTIDVVYTPEELAAPRESPWGTTNGELKRRLEFSVDEYGTIKRWCAEAGLAWFVSPWDIGAVDEIEMLDPPAWKIASPCLTDDALIRRVMRTDKPIILSTGMSTVNQIEHALHILDGYPTVLLHAVSCYPCPVELCNLRAIDTLKNLYRTRPLVTTHVHQPLVGYSGHETGLAPTLAAVALGACMVERHVTLDRSMFGSDQSASLEPTGLRRLVRDIRAVEAAMGNGSREDVLEQEKPALKKLRRIG
jgi:N-acetylneuraminate synthase